MPIRSSPTKEKVVAYIDPALSRLLRLEKAETRQPVTDIIEDLVRNHFASQAKRGSRASA